MFPEKVPQFFKIILEHNIREAKLAFPRKFVRDYGNCLPELVVLNVPGVEGWYVELKRCDGEIWLHKGWQEFVEFYSLAEGHFLLFKYEGNFHFRVLIFDKSATEIDYPCIEKPLTQGQSQEPYKEQTHDHVAAEILGDFTSSCKTGQTSSPPRPRGRKVKTTQCRNVRLVNSNRKLKSGNYVGKSKGNFEQIPFKKTAGKQATRGSIPSGIRLAHGAKSKFNRYPSFTVVFRLYHFTRNTMQIPRGFLGTQSHYHGQIVMLELGSRLWPVKLLIYKYGKFQCFSAGWSTFARENSLQAKDVCTFELVERELIKVSICRKDC